MLIVALHFHISLLCKVIVDKAFVPIRIFNEMQLTDQSTTYYTGRFYERLNFFMYENIQKVD
jgi:hypothetical protein